MKTLIVIPARYKSKRFPGKPLSLIRDREGKRKTLIERTWESARKIKNIDNLIISTDDKRIEKECKNFGANVIITSEKCKNGTERVGETVKILENNYDIVINFQGDSPLTPSDYVNHLINTMKKRSVKVATPVIEIDKTLFNNIRSDQKKSIIGATSVVFNKKLDALYFSKSFIPSIKATSLFKRKSFYFHVGLYAFRQNLLDEYLSFGESNLEKLEGLEQLRFLENGIPIKCVPVDKKDYGFWEVNNPTDIKIIEKILSSGRF